MCPARCLLRLGSTALRSLTVFSNKPKWAVLLTKLALSVGCLIGLYSLAVSGVDWPPSDRLPGSFLQWYTIGGMGLVGIAFIAGSILALRDRRLGGIVFLISLPVASYLLADPDSGFLVWHDGGGYWETPLPSTGVGLTALFFAPFAILFLAHRRRKLALSLFVISALIAVFIFRQSRWTSVLIPHLLESSALLVLFSLFWLVTHRLGWPPLIQTRQSSTPTRIAEVLAICLSVLCLDATLTIGLAAMRSSLFAGDCGERAPSTSPRRGDEEVFTARIILAGPSLETVRTSPSGIWTPEAAYIPRGRVGDWAIGVVEEKFWGLPPWMPPIVLLTDDIYWRGETYFIDGRRGHGLFDRFLPIVSTTPGCSRTRVIDRASVDMRLLHQPLSATGRRVIGHMWEPEAYRDSLSPPVPVSPAAGVPIDVVGPSGTRRVNTDQSGLYELDDLPAGEYTLEPLIPPNEVLRVYSSSSKFRLHEQDLVEVNLDLSWK